MKITKVEPPPHMATFIWQVVDFCLLHQGMALPWVKNREELFRYCAFCNYTGRLNACVENEKVVAVVFCWPDFKERIEAKAAEGVPQFEWAETHRGDSMFIADVIGTRQAVARLYQAALEKFPQLVNLPKFTYRRGKLVLLSGKLIERMVNKL